MRALHLVPGINDIANGMVVVARLLAKEQGDADVVDLKNADRGKIAAADEVWVHGMWLPREWAVCRAVLRAGTRLVRMTHGSLSPIYLTQQSPLKKKLISPIERYFLRRADKVIATCEAEAGWIRSYLARRCPPIEVTDLKRFFKLNNRVNPVNPIKKTLHLLYLGRRHPLKGVEYLEAAVNGLKNIDFRIVTDAAGEEKKCVWDWCDVLVLPSLSENFGLVVAEALERGKRVITTDGAPAWGDGNTYGGRLVYLKGYRDGSPEKRVELLREALKTLMS